MTQSNRHDQDVDIRQISQERRFACDHYVGMSGFPPLNFPLMFKRFAFDGRRHLLMSSFRRRKRSGKGQAEVVYGMTALPAETPGLLI